MTEHQLFLDYKSDFWFSLKFHVVMSYSGVLVLTCDVKDWIEHEHITGVK